jgi:hypothetical protein
MYAFVDQHFPVDLTAAARLATTPQGVAALSTGMVPLKFVVERVAALLPGQLAKSLKYSTNTGILTFGTFTAYVGGSQSWLDRLINVRDFGGAVYFQMEEGRSLNNASKVGGVIDAVLMDQVGNVLMAGAVSLLLIAGSGGHGAWKGISPPRGVPIEFVNTEKPPSLQRKLESTQRLQSQAQTPRRRTPSRLQSQTPRRRTPSPLQSQAQTPRRRTPSPLQSQAQMPQRRTPSRRKRTSRPS